jgi:hypothetical protein
LDFRYSESAFRILAESVAIDNFPKENNEVTSGSKKRLGAKRKDNFATQNNEHREWLTANRAIDGHKSRAM